ncbi:poly(A)-specific ribonuclease PARN isoform X2 [Asparagus officinalis]|uniref:poly(A)-specific ribonuclease PARN isoform X2 n=1 Tax=Asparagus officinalis TaxID=4686 RepID=UPI00098E7E33|nr:poly(A)-specific ribonuclease PARN isoform X2 [Asparagus officinalis]
MDTRRAQEAEALQKLSSSYEDRLSNSNPEEWVEIPTGSTSDLLFTERMKIRFQEWRDGIIRHPNGVCPLEENPDSKKLQFQTIFFKMRPAVQLNGFNSHQLKLIKLVLRKHVKDLVYVRTDDENSSPQNIVVYADSEQDKFSLMKEVKDDHQKSSEAKIESSVGFRHVIDILSSEKKLIIGHNCLLDIAHICCKFVGPLPLSMGDFASFVHKVFPYIVDTKHLISASNAIQYLMKKSSKSLSSAFSLLCPKISSASQSSASNSYVKVEVETNETCETGLSCWNSGAKHEAGYDAFMTGCVFAQACSLLGIKFETNSPTIDFTRNEKLQHHINLLYPSWNSGTVINLSTGVEAPELGYKRKYPTIVFSNIVLVWGFLSKLAPKDLKDCISKVFGADSVTSVFFLDSTAALVQFSKEEFVNDFLILKDTLEKNDDAIAVLHPLAKLLEGGNTRAAGYETYKEICGASASKVLFADQAEAIGIRWKTKIDRVNEEAKDVDEYSDVKQRNERKTDKEKSNHQISYDDVLSSLRASKPLCGKHVKNT